MSGRLPSDWRAWLLACAAVLLLNASLTFGNVWPTPAIRWQPALSVELAVIVLAVAALGRRADRLTRRALPAVWLVLVAGRYLDVTAPGLYGRPVNLYWDSPHLVNVAAMLTETVPAGMLVAGAVAIVLAVAVAFVAARLAWRAFVAALQRPLLRPGLIALAASVTLLFASAQVVPLLPAGIVFADPVLPAYARQVRSVLAMVGPGAVAPALDPSPAALASTPDGLDGADVQLVFVESYGAVAFESPAITATLASSRAAVESAVRETGRRLVSAYVESPTFGGSSWLAHLSLLSGVPVRDAYSYQALMTERRDTLVTAFARAGYRTVALMPGMRQAWPEGAFYGYDAIYGRDDLAYAGPQFGWWSIPDQYALARLDALEGRPGARAPLFVVFPTSTTHAPFGPVAPYQPDWSRVLGTDAYDAGDVERILASRSDLANLGADYARAMSYEFTTFAGYLRERAADDLVMVLVGDHQPPAAVAGEGATWTVPVHIVTGRDDVAARLVAHGFHPGLTPARPSLGAMHALVPALLDAFARRPEE